MAKTKLKIWGREFDLDIVYENFPDEAVTFNQKTTAALIRLVNFSDALDAVKVYIQEKYAEDLDGEKINNIFHFIMPKCILVPHVESGKIFAIMCNFRYDMEHGMAIVFENGKLKKIGPEDIIL